MKIIHVTTVHSRLDTRIRVKEVETLGVQFPNSVFLFVQDGKGDSIESDGRVQIRDVGPSQGNRLFRMLLGTWRMYLGVRAEDGAILVHFHDPELIILGLMLKLTGVKVIYDVHEDVPRQIQSKEWVASRLRGLVAGSVEALERVAARSFDAIVPATPRIAGRFPADTTVMVQNFPILSELLTPCEQPYAERPPHFAYVGGVCAIRGAREMIQALGQLGNIVGLRLRVAGLFEPPNLRAELEQLAGWAMVDYHGWADRKQVAELLSNARAGLIVSHPTMNNIEAYPVKMFEYMAAGLPVIASDFPVWSGVVGSARCGLLVDPMNPIAIAEAMRWLLEHPDEAAAMGRRGRAAVEQRYNWEQESKKLLALYERLI